MTDYYEDANIRTNTGPEAWNDTNYPVLAEKQDDGGDLPESAVTTQIGGGWGTFLDRAVIQTNEAFNGEHVNALTVNAGSPLDANPGGSIFEGQTWRSAGGSTIGSNDLEIPLVTNIADEQHVRVEANIHGNGPGGRHFFREVKGLFRRSGSDMKVWCWLCVGPKCRVNMSYSTASLATVDPDIVCAYVKGPTGATGVTINWTIDYFARVIG